MMMLQNENLEFKRKNIELQARFDAARGDQTKGEGPTPERKDVSTDNRSATLEFSGGLASESAWAGLAAKQTG